VFHPLDRLLVLHANVRLGRKRLTLANTLAYCTVIIIADVKSFVIQGGEKKNE
jgi:hypothetical protein